MLSFSVPLIMQGLWDEYAIELFTYIVVLFVDFISLRIPSNNDDFPDPIYPNIIINFPFSIVRFMRWITGVKVTSS
jgi:hypothetical protein